MIILKCCRISATEYIRLGSTEIPSNSQYDICIITEGDCFYALATSSIQDTLLNEEFTAYLFRTREDIEKSIKVGMG